MKKSLLVFGAIMLALISAHAQENCGNGIDDDGDGLADCLDPDCTGNTVPTGAFFNTATDGSGGILSPGSGDSNWQISTGSMAGPYTPAIVMMSPPSVYYASPWPDCDWISHSLTGNHVFDTDYYYKIEFLLPCVNSCGVPYSDPGAFCLYMDFYADNSVDAVYVNGVLQTGIAGVPAFDPYYHLGYTAAEGLSLSICNDWQPGLNTLIIKVSSGPGNAGFLAQNSTSAPVSVGNPTISGVGAGSIVCTDDGVVNLSAASPGGAWSATCGTCINSTTGAFDPVAAGVGTHTVTYDLTVPCPASDTALVVVQAPASVYINPTSTYCAASSPFTITASVPGGTWSADCGGCIDSGMGTFDPAAAGVGVHTVTYTTGGACPATDIEYVNITSGPDATILAVADVCTGAPSFAFSAASPGGTWSASCGTCINAVTGVFNPAAAGVGTHTVTYTIGGACTGSDTQTITVNASGTAAINPVNTHCVSAGVFTITATSAGGTWSASCGACINSSTGVFDPAAAGVGTHTVTYTIGGPCGSVSAASVSISDISITGTGTAVSCHGESNGIIAATASGSGAFTYLLTGPQTGTNTTGIFTGLPAGSYTVSVTNGAGCTASTNIAVTSPPQVTASFTASPTSGIAPLTVEFTNTSANATAYSWHFGNGIQSVLENPAPVIYTGDSVYVVMLIATNGACADTAYASIHVTSPSHLVVYNVFSPNGDGQNDVFSVSWKNISQYSCQVFDRWGLLMFETTDINTVWNGKNLNGNACTDGTYYYIIQGKGDDDKVYDFHGTVSLFRDK